MNKTNLVTLFPKYVSIYPADLEKSHVKIITDFNIMKAGDYICIFYDKARLPGFYFGKIYAVIPNTKSVIITIDKYFKEYWRKRFVGKTKMFKFESKLQIFFIIKKNDLKSQAETRKAYAEHRRALMNARGDERNAYIVLGLLPGCSADVFSQKKREMMFKYHPDRMIYSGLSENIFLAKSKEVTDAIALLSKYFK